VSEPPAWCAGMVIVPKKNGKVQIGVDHKPLNRSVMCGAYLLSKVDATISQLTGAKIFSKLDAYSGFCKFPYPHIHVYSPHLSLQWDVTVLTNLPLEYQVHQSCFNTG